MLGQVEPILRSLVFLEDEIVDATTAVGEDRHAAVRGRNARVLRRPKIENSRDPCCLKHALCERFLRHVYVDVQHS